jgi:hypothetical protein
MGGPGHCSSQDRRRVDFDDRLAARASLAADAELSRCFVRAQTASSGATTSFCTVAVASR